MKNQQLLITNYKLIKLFLIDTKVDKIDSKKIDKLISKYKNVKQIQIRQNIKYTCKYELNGNIYSGNMKGAK